MKHLGTRIRNAMQCKGEREYLGAVKDCVNCDDKYLCESKRARAFRVNKESYIFAETEEQAKHLTKTDKIFATNVDITEVDVKKIANTLIIKTKHA